MMKIKKRNLIIIVIILFAVYIGIIEKEYYVVDLENRAIELSEDEKNILIGFLKIKQQDDDLIEITKIAYEHPYMHEGGSYIFYKIGENEYMYEYMCGYTYNSYEFEFVEKCVKNRYKWWKSIGKQKDVKEIRNNKKVIWHENDSNTYLITD